ncbi:MAG: Uma2 family endonuclease [Acaryochloris sp. RU_4_1]|nr:Uma2 family endonuclease [Acaryochloris sp. RU_4_1]NJR57237.1 Uma2 family endonuclease [Acaryochloris sp. CRU_2_0]
MTAFTIDLSSITTLTDEQFDRLCTANPELKFERTPTGELVIMPPTGGETGMNNATLISRFVVWNEQTNLGKVFDSSTCFRIPGGGDRSPDVAWVSRDRWDALTPEQQRKFPPICPDFVLELLSPSDSLCVTQQKMQEYLSCGIRLGWLINPEDKQVEIYRPGQQVEVLRSPKMLSGESVLPGLTLEMGWIWR